MNKKARLKFITLSIITLVLIGAIITLISTGAIKKYFLTDIKGNYQEKIQAKAGDYFDLTRPVSLRLSGDHLGYAKTIEKIPGISRVKILDPNGTIIYSQQSKELGTTLKNNALLAAVINNGAEIEKIDYQKRFVLISAPIVSSEGEVRGIVQSKLETKDIAGQIYTFIIQLLLSTGSLALLFFILMYLIFSDMARAVEQEDTNIVEKSKSLEEEQQLDQAIMASVAESLIVINKSGQIILFNPSAEEVTGLKESDVQYRAFKKALVFVDKDGKVQKENPIEASLKKGIKTEVKIKDGFFIKHTSGTLTPVSIAVAPIQSKAEVVNGVVVTIQDISSEKELDKVKDEFVYVVAHELGNPIFAMDGYLSLLDDKIKKTDFETKGLLTSTRSLNQQLSSLVNDLLEVVRNEQGQLTCEVTAVNLKNIILETIKSATFKAKGKNIDITLGSLNGAKVIANEQKIREVIVNLVDNAIKYTPEGGKIEVSSVRSGDIINTHIKDTGYGMTTEEQEKLFSKFYRIKDENTKNISGTGLGLFICKQIVEKCGGTISVQSDKGKGSTFTFSLKIAKK